MFGNARWRLGALLWLAAMSGVGALALTVLPQLLDKAASELAPGVILAASILQSGLFLLLAVWAGVKLSGPVGLGAPVIEAALSGAPVWPALRRQLAAAAIVALVVGAVLAGAARMAPAELAAAGRNVAIPLVVKVLYGGVTEEVLMRWGLMTALIWLPWRLMRKDAHPPGAAIIVCAIAVTACLFGVMHLPAAAALGADLTTSVVMFIMLGNAVPAVLFGWLYWRRGIEAAIMAHALGHIIGVAGGAG